MRTWHNRTYVRWIGIHSRREVIARFDALAGQNGGALAAADPTAESADWMGQISTAVRIENQVVATQYARDRGTVPLPAWAVFLGTEDWAVDTMAAVAAEVAAGLRIAGVGHRPGALCQGDGGAAPADRAGVRRRRYRLSGSFARLCRAPIWSSMVRRWRGWMDGLRPMRAVGPR